MVWWIWVLVGIACLAVEILIPGGIVMLFFGAAALLVGGLVAAEIGGPVWFQWVLFSVLSVVSLLTLRSPIIRWLDNGDSGADNIDAIAGKTALLLEDLAPRAEGKAELRGTSWTARNVGEVPLAQGETCVVEKVDGLTLHLRRNDS
jgi:membrane protein implicated in regulation of membrane protease activity